jgi:hypothetical protein
MVKACIDDFHRMVGSSPGVVGLGMEWCLGVPIVNRIGLFGVLNGLALGGYLLCLSTSSVWVWCQSCGLVRHDGSIGFCGRS